LEEDEMKIADIRIHNYRSIADETLRLGGYSLLIGANNSGKSNVIDALRTYYEKDLKFEADRDFPRFPSEDKESWVEVEYELSEEEASTIKSEYLMGKRRFRVRKWLNPQEKAKQGLFGYERGRLSENLFYGWKNVGQGKLGNLIYIPAVSHLEEHTKLSGPSALRDLINDILKPIVKSSEAFALLTQQFESFGAAIKNEETQDKRSLAGLEQRVNEEIDHWGAAFNLDVTSPGEDDIVKNLISHTITDRSLGQKLDPESFGHGFQRHLIFTLIRVSASYTMPKAEPEKKEFSPELELLLFEEPEAFLHPPQQNILDKNLRKVAAQAGRQVLAATHSPIFVSHNADDIADLIRVRKSETKSEVGQITRDRLEQLFEQNVEDMRVIFGNGAEQMQKGSDDDGLAVELEAVRHFLWLNPDRSNMFFADHILIVEGLSDQVLVNFLRETGGIPDPGKGIFVLECFGKFHIPRFMKLCEQMKIPHSVLYDMDGDKAGKEKEKQDRASELIERTKNEFTVSIDSLSDNLERFLGLEVRRDDRWKKASRILLAAHRGEIDPQRLLAFEAKVTGLMGSPTEAKPL
jgi:putative ATP-dependent endonuclease of OLD family